MITAVEDDDDGCLSSYTPPRNWWVSDSSNDLDGDGCRDADEDSDDDGDGFDDADGNKMGTSTLGTCTDALIVMVTVGLIRGFMSKHAGNTLGGLLHALMVMVMVGQIQTMI